MRTDELLASVQRLLDVEAIRTLKHRYAQLCDRGYPADEISMLFTEDAVWHGEPLGRFEGREAIRDFFAATPETLRFAIHYLGNSVIDVRGDTATGSWYLWQSLVARSSDQAYWLMATYSDEYRRGPDGWQFSSMNLHVKSFTPYEQGPGKVQMSRDFG